jgi:hypothetical protein
MMDDHDHDDHDHDAAAASQNRTLCGWMIMIMMRPPPEPDVVSPPEPDVVSKHEDADRRQFCLIALFETSVQNAVLLNRRYKQLQDWLQDP